MIQISDLSKAQADNRDNRQYIVWHPFVTQTVLMDLASEMSMNKDYRTIKLTVKERNKGGRQKVRIIYVEYQ